VGALLSGGIDSSLVTSLAVRSSRSPVETFSIGMLDEEFNEAPAARAVAARLGTRHHEKTLGRDADQILGRLVRHYGEPFGDSSAVPTYVVSGLARENVKVVISGDGGDECFAGYTWLAGAMKSFAFPPRTARDAAKRWARTAQRAVRREPHERQALRSLERSRSCFDPVARGELWQPDMRTRAAGRPSLVELSASELQGLDLCAQIQLLDFAWYLPSDILTKVDVASMACGLEVRVPYLDHEVVELMSRMPSSMKIREDRTNGIVTKYAMRRVAERYLDSEVVQRPKKGFCLPEKSWFVDGKLEAVEELLTGRGSRLGMLFRRTEIRDLIHGHVRNGSGSRIWALWVLQEWLDQHPGATV